LVNRDNQFGLLVDIASGLFINYVLRTELCAPDPPIAWDFIDWKSLIICVDENLVVDERIGILRRHLVGPIDLSIGLLEVFDRTRSIVVSLSEPNSKAEHSQQDQNERPAGLS
jgi:hypothetical protein